MRVLTLSWEYPPHVVGGLGKHLMDLAPALAEQGVELHVVTPLLRGGASHEVTSQGVHIYRVEPPRMDAYGFVSYVQHSNGLMEAAARIIADEHGPFELIHAHDWLSAHAAVSLKHAWRRPLVTTFHATERGRQGGYIGGGHAEQVNHIEWWLSYESWRVITCSQFMAEQVNSYFGAPLDKIDVVPNGVYVVPSPFRSEAERLEFRRRYAEDDQPLVFYVGRLVYEKGLHVLLDSWPQVLAAFPKAQLVIAGTGAYLDSLKHRAWAMGIAPSVTFAGFISDEDRDRLYYCVDLATFPSLYEPFGIVALEAMAACCPVVVAETGGLTEVVKLHETGLTVHSNDPASLAWGILHTLRHPEWSKARAANALKVARDAFNWRQIASETIAVYQRTYADWARDTWGK